MEQPKIFLKGFVVTLSRNSERREIITVAVSIDDAIAASENRFKDWRVKDVQLFFHGCIITSLAKVKLITDFQNKLKEGGDLSDSNRETTSNGIQEFSE